MINYKSIKAWQAQVQKHMCIMCDTAIFTITKKWFKALTVTGGKPVKDANGVIKP